MSSATAATCPRCGTTRRRARALRRHLDRCGHAQAGPPGAAAVFASTVLDFKEKLELAAELERRRTVAQQAERNQKRRARPARSAAAARVRKARRNERLQGAALAGRPGLRLPRDALYQPWKNATVRDLADIPKTWARDNRRELRARAGALGLPTWVDYGLLLLTVWARELGAGLQVSTDDLAALFGVHRSTICRARVRLRAHRWIGGRTPRRPYGAAARLTGDRWIDADGKARPFTLWNDPSSGKHRGRFDCVSVTYATDKALRLVKTLDRETTFPRRTHGRRGAGARARPLEQRAWASLWETLRRASRNLRARLDAAKRLGRDATPNEVDAVEDTYAYGAVSALLRSTGPPGAG